MSSRAHRFFTALFGEPEAINGNGAVTDYLYRWTIAKPGEWRLYLHHFVGPDWARDLHDHPKRFWSLGLKGGYVERVPIFPPAWHPCRALEGPAPDTTRTRLRRHRAPWLRSWRPHHIHRIERILTGSCWTLVLVGPTEAEWGFYTRAGWVRADRYVKRHGGPPTTYDRAAQ